MKKIIYKLHLWLGLISGLLVFVIAVTGALYAFQEEISSIGSYHHVVEKNQPFMAPSGLQKMAERQLPGKVLHAVKYQSRDKAAEAVFYGFNPTYYYKVYLNPYTGEVLKVKDMNRDFFRFIMQGHFYLWLPPVVGQPLVAGATLVFVIVLITGLIIWIPKNKAALKNRLWFRWKKGVKWPRVNYDLHVIGGLYVKIFALILALTGLVWGFPWFAQTLHRATGGEKSLMYNDIAPRHHVPTDTLASDQAIDRVWLQMQKEYPAAASIEIHPPHTDSTLVAANATQADGKYWKTDYRYFDRYSLKEVKVDHIYGRFGDANAADKLLRMNYEIHTGAIIGLPGKILAFLVSLFIASLPVTGIVIWWRKRKKH